jgi:hypothetical protein
MKKSTSEVSPRNFYCAAFGSGGKDAGIFVHVRVPPFTLIDPPFIPKSGMVCFKSMLKAFKFSGCCDSPSVFVHRVYIPFTWTSKADLVPAESIKAEALNPFPGDMKSFIGKEAAPFHVS